MAELRAFILLLLHTIHRTQECNELSYSVLLLNLPEYLSRSSRLTQKLMEEQDHLANLVMLCFIVVHVLYLINARETNDDKY